MYKPTVLSQFGIPNKFSNFPKKTCIFIDEKIYNDKIAIIEENYNISLEYADFHERVNQIILKKQND